MTFFVEQSEASAVLRTIPFRVYLSNGTTPDTGLSNDSLRISLPGASETTATNLISAASAGAGMYLYQLAAAECATLGNVALSC